MLTNSVLKNIQERRSIRSFEAKDLTQEELDQLRLAALAAPTARDRQLLKFSFILDHNVAEEISQAVIQKLQHENKHEDVEMIKSRHPSIFYGAPLLIVISSPPDDNYAAVNAGIAVQTLAIAAQSMGLGSCIIGFAARAFKGNKANHYKKIAKIPDGHEFFISIAIGHPAMSKEAHKLTPDNIIFVR